MNAVAALTAAAPGRVTAAGGGFRADINGLRAIAILTVMAFHFGLPGMRGGFGGVDVFYVISGYLMTGILVSRLDAGRFSLLDFYADRTLRIVPALLVLLVMALLLGALLLVPLEFAVLGKNTMMAALFAANLRFKIAYFGPEIDQEWLLHTWSLALEWQFYMVFPLAVWALWRRGGRAWLVPGLALAALASFAVSLWLTWHWPIAAFYLLPARGWELLGGGLIFFAPRMSARWARAGQLSGLALIVLGAMTAGERGWPGWQALLPVGGTMLVIAAGLTQSALTGNALLGWIGLNSYSIYLWHWPVALWVRRFHPGEPLWIAAGVAASFALGYASWRLVEPLPRRFANRRRTALLLLAGLALTAAGGFVVARSHGWVSRYAPAVAAVETEMALPQPFPPECFSVVGEVPARCTLGTGPLAATVLGDSHAAAVLAGVRAALPPGRSLGFNAYASCMPVLGAVSNDPVNHCAEFNAALLAPLIRPRSAPVVLVANWQAYLDRGTMVFGSSDAAPDPALLARRFTETACALTRAGPTYALLPEPSFPTRVPVELQALLIDERGGDVTVPLADDRRAKAGAVAMLSTAAARCGLRLIDPAAALCPGGQCRGSDQGHPLYYDRDHLTVLGAQRLTPLFAPLFAPPARPAR